MAKGRKSAAPNGLPGPSAGSGSLADSELELARSHLLDKRRSELAAVADTHDTAVRELFYLDKYTSLVYFDPEDIKQRNSDVFQTFQREYDLFASSGEGHGAGQGSGAKRRTTRGQMTERRSATIGAPAPAVKARPEPVVHPKRDRKGKAKAVEVVDDDFEMLEGDEAEEEEEEEEAEAEEVVEVKPKKGKRPKGRLALAAAQGERRSSGRIAAADAIAESLALAAANAKKSAPAPPSSPKAKQPKIPASWVASGSYKRLRLTPDDPIPIVPTHPIHLTVGRPTFGGSLADLMDSFTCVDDDPDLLPLSKQAVGGKAITKFTMEERFAHEAWLRLRIDELRAEGRLADSPEGAAAAAEEAATARSRSFGAAARRPPAEPERKQREDAHWSHVLSQGLHFGELVRDERTRHVAMAKRAAKAVMGYWDRKGNEEEREREKEERERVKTAKWTVREVRKKWRLAVNIIRAKVQQAEREEAERLAKEHLNVILQKSSKALEAQGADINARSEASEEEEESDAEEESEEEESEEADESEVEQEAEDDDGAVDQAKLETAPVSDAAPDIDDRPAPTPIPRPNGASQSDAAPSTTTAVAPAVSPSASPVVNGRPPGDEEFLASDDEARAQADEDWEAEMEDEEGERANEDDSDVEMAGLAEDAELPIEELMKKYGYGANGAAEVDASTEAEEVEVEDEDSRAATEEPEVEVDGDVFRSDDSADEERDDADREMEDAMEQEDEGSDDDEDRGLAADAEIPIEELRAKYQAMLEAELDDEGDGEEEDEDEDAGEEGEEAESSTKDEVDGMDVDEGAAAAEDQDEEDEEVVTAVRIPFLLRADMRPYQKTGLDWLSSLARRGLSGILADEMGLGKTLQTIALLAHLACDRGIWGPHLIVVPTSVMLNWDTEFKKFFPGFKVITYYGNAKERKEKRRGWNTEGSFHVVVTSYQLVLADQHIFRRKPWYYLVLDEAHHIKNFRSKRWETLLGFNTQRRLLLTGTPLQNNLMELWSLLYFLMPPGMADEDGPFASSDLFREWFSAGTEKAIESGQLIDRDTVAKLHTVLRPYLLRRLKADVEKQMPAKHEHVLYCRLSKRQRYLYDDYMSRAQTRDTLASGNFMSIINCLMQLRKVCNHPDLFETRPIVTSFALPRAAAADYEVEELLVRRRLLDEHPMAEIDFATLRLFPSSSGAGERSALVAAETARLDATELLDGFGRTFVEDGFDEAADVPKDTKSLAGWKAYFAHSRDVATLDRFRGMMRVNRLRCQAHPPLLGGAEGIALVGRLGVRQELVPLSTKRRGLDEPELVPAMVSSYEDRQVSMHPFVSRFAFATPKVVAPGMGTLALAEVARSEAKSAVVRRELLGLDGEGRADVLHPATVKLTIAFPDRSLIQYDCGKLQQLSLLLRRLEEQGSRALIFTQMTKVLDVLEEFLTFNGYRYLRLDGSTKVEQRQMLTERFNTDPKIMAFISSTRAGGLGINLTGADTVVFYDNDWNPSMDRQCQDRCHRIGQTRDVHIYRFVSEHTIEENMLKKAEQKRLLDQAVIQEGDFTTDYFAKSDWRDMLGPDVPVPSSLLEAGDRGGGGGKKADREVRAALAAAEDEEDAVAAKAAEGEDEGRLDNEDFGGPPDGGQVTGGTATPLVGAGGGAPGEEVVATTRQVSDVDEEEAEVVMRAPAAGEEDEDGDGLEGTVDGYMLEWVERDWDYFGEPGFKW